MEEAQTQRGWRGGGGEEGVQPGSPTPEWQPTPAEVRASSTLQHRIIPLRGPQAGRALVLRKGAVGKGLGCLLPAVVAHTPARSHAPQSTPLSWGWGLGGHGLPGDTGRPPIPCCGAAQLAEGSGGLGDSRQVAAPAAGPPCPGLGRAAGAGSSRVPAQVGMLGWAMRGLGR